MTGARWKPEAPLRFSQVLDDLRVAAPARSDSPLEPFSFLPVAVWR